MSDNPDDTPTVPAAEPPAAPAAAAVPAAAVPATTPWHRHRAFPLVLVGLIGLLLGCLIGGSLVAVAAAVHDHGRPGHHMRYDERGPRFHQRQQPQGPMFPKRVVPQNPAAPGNPQPGNPQPAPSVSPTA